MPDMPARCSGYQRVGSSVHEYRWRTLRDLPILGHSVSQRVRQDGAHCPPSSGHDDASLAARQAITPALVPYLPTPANDHDDETAA